MSNSPLPISNLPNVQSTGLTPNDLLVVVNYDLPSGTTKNITTDEFKTYITSGITNSFTGGTISGSTEFTNGLTANTLSVNGVSITGDTYVTGGTYFSGGTIVFDYSTGSNFQVTGLTEDLNNEIAGLAETDEETIELNLTTNKIQLKEMVASATGGTRTFQGDFAISGGTLNLDTIGSGSPIINLGLDSSGEVVTGTTGGSSVNPYNNSGSGSTINWDVSGTSTNYEATLTATTTLNLTNVRNGDFGTIIIRQDGVGSRTLTLGTINGSAGTHSVANSGGGSIILTPNASAIDILTFTYNGSIMFWTVSNDYT